MTSVHDHDTDKSLQAQGGKMEKRRKYQVVGGVVDVRHVRTCCKYDTMYKRTSVKLELGYETVVYDKLSLSRFNSRPGTAVKCDMFNCAKAAAGNRVVTVLSLQ
jgi:hypothetical protein